MNTHDIELPEPKYPGTKLDIPNAIPDLYTTDQVIAAIEADRKHRGEPVFYVNPKIVDPDTGKIARHVTDAVTWSSKPVAGAWTMPVYAAPQPTEPSRGEPVAWLYEDELPDNYPYEAMFPYSKVDGVRMFPVYAPQPADPTVKESLLVAEPVKVPIDDAIDVLKLALEYWSDRQQRYRNRAPVWVQEARALLARYCHKEQT